MALTIVPLRVGTVPGVTFAETGAPMAVLMFLVLGGPAPVVVDTGSPAPDVVLARQGVVLVRPPEEDPGAAVEAWGVRPADVKVVIQTHLHWDHCANGALFPDAEIVIQETELRYAVQPTMGDRATFDLVPGATPGWLADIPRMRVVDGDTRIDRGIRTLHLPGHTPGFQAVLVDTAKGQHLLAGDLVPSYSNWHGDAARRHIYGPYTDLPALERSWARMDELGAVVIPSHDDEAVARGPFG
jgi:glyoxylase-like metal-dependent hydrolase (beta-lactamase superfamily II)